MAGNIRDLLFPSPKLNHNVYCDYTKHCVKKVSCKAEGERGLGKEEEYEGRRGGEGISQKGRRGEAATPL